MEPFTATCKLFRAEDFFAAENLDRADAAVIEIFAMMFNFEIMPIDALPSHLPSAEPDGRTAIVGFSGPMRGSCQIQISSVAAKSIASAMLGGIPVEEDDDSINDALGELCNMLAGGWKNSVPELSAECVLTPPTVISGHDYRVYSRRPSADLVRTYQFNTHTLHLTLHCEENEPPRP